MDLVEALLKAGASLKWTTVRKNGDDENGGTRIQIMEE
jgi:hypothetical protein